MKESRYLLIERGFALKDQILALDQAGPVAQELNWELQGIAQKLRDRRHPQSEYYERGFFLFTFFAEDVPDASSHPP